MSYRLWKVHKDILDAKNEKALMGQVGMEETDRSDGSLYSTFDTSCTSLQLFGTSSDDLDVNSQLRPRTKDFQKGEEARIFKKAKEYINLGSFFRRLVWIYANRKLWLLFWIHLLGTVVVWGT